MKKTTKKRTLKNKTSVGPWNVCTSSCARGCSFVALPNKNMVPLGGPGQKYLIIGLYFPTSAVHSSIWLLIRWCLYAATFIYIFSGIIHHLLTAAVLCLANDSNPLPLLFNAAPIPIHTKHYDAFFYHVNCTSVHFVSGFVCQGEGQADWGRIA